jgi:glycerol-3-phosphate dehydrogenase (NAD(P)+)
MPKRITVVGGGSWATALIKILSEGSVSINWWMRSGADAAYITQTGHNRSYLRDVPIDPQKVRLRLNIREAFRNTDLVIVAVPAAFVTDALAGLEPRHFSGKQVVSAIKGMIPGRNILVTDWLEQTYHIAPAQLAVIAGPCHAEEVALEKQSYLTIASPGPVTARAVADRLACRYIRTAVSSDLYGVEYCAVMKNIIALGCGIAHGLGYGDNFQAVLVANAMQEISRFLEAIRPQPRDLLASAYLGDLLVTAYSPFSRNRTFGNLIGRGYTVQSAQAEMKMVAEGYYALKSIHALNGSLGVNMPITGAAYRIVYENVSPGLEISALKELLM